MTMQLDLCVGKLYRITNDSGDGANLGVKSTSGLVVFKRPLGVGESMTPSFLTIDTGQVVMWLGIHHNGGEQWAKLLHGDTVYSIFLGHHHNLKRLERVELP